MDERTPLQSLKGILGCGCDLEEGVVSSTPLVSQEEVRVGTTEEETKGQKTVVLIMKKTRRPVHLIDDLGFGSIGSVSNAELLRGRRSDDCEESGHITLVEMAGHLDPTGRASEGNP